MIERAARMNDPALAVDDEDRRQRAHAESVRERERLVDELEEGSGVVAEILANDIARLPDGHADDQPTARACGALEALESGALRAAGLAPRGPKRNDRGTMIQCARDPRRAVVEGRHGDVGHRLQMTWRRSDGAARQGERERDEAQKVRPDAHENTHTVKSLSRK